MKSTLTVLYRSTGGDNPKDRPAYYSKMLCLRSFLAAIEPVRERCTLIFVNDGPMPDDRLAVMAEHGRIVSFPGLGNSGSYRATLQLAIDLKGTDLVYFAEDDYLYLPEAFTALLDAADELPDVEYFTLYDHRDRYTRNDDARGGFSRVMVAGGRHWRSVESTCMTYGARLAALRSDAWIHRLITTPNVPRDRMLWRMTQGIGNYFWKFPRRTLIGPIPSLATHMDPVCLAPNIDWERVAQEIRKTMTDNGQPAGTR